MRVEKIILVTAEIANWKIGTHSNSYTTESIKELTLLISKKNFKGLFILLRIYYLVTFSHFYQAEKLSHPL